MDEEKEDKNFENIALAAFLGFIAGGILCVILAVSSHNGLFWQDKEQKIIKYDNSLYKLVPVKYIEE